MSKAGPITLTIDMSDHVAKSQEVLDELQARLKQFSPCAAEDFVLRSLLLEMTFDYLQAKKEASSK